jgi:hypothetical protein
MTRIVRGFGPRVLAFLFAAMLPGALATGAAVAADNIGVTSAAQNHVEGVMGSQTTPLKVGSPVYQNEHVRTAAASTAQLLFRDQTSLSVGPSSDVTLDKFVYDPATNSGSAVISATRGALRFVSGTQEPHNYQLRTPVATIGVRGTVVDTLVDEHKTSVILGECCADITLAACSLNAAPPPAPQQQPQPNGECLVHLDVVGTGFTLFDDGRMDGPFVFDGSEHDGVGSTTFPLHTSQMAVESHEPDTASTQDLVERGDETTILDQECTGPDCGCQDCGPGF